MSMSINILFVTLFWVYVLSAVYVCQKITKPEPDGFRKCLLSIAYLIGFFGTVAFENLCSLANHRVCTITGFCFIDLVLMHCFSNIFRSYKHIKEREMSDSKENRPILNEYSAAMVADIHFLICKDCLWSIDLENRHLKLSETILDALLEWEMRLKNNEVIPGISKLSQLISYTADMFEQFDKLRTLDKAEGKPIAFESKLELLDAITRLENCSIFYFEQKKTMEALERLKAEFKDAEILKQTLKDFSGAKKMQANSAAKYINSN